MSCSEFVSPDALLDLRFCSQQPDALPLLGAPVSWDLGDELGRYAKELDLAFAAWTLFMAFLCHHSFFTTSKSLFEWSPHCCYFFCKNLNSPLN